MKKILLLSLLFLCLLSFGKCHKKKKCCKKKTNTATAVSKINPQEVWMQYDETKCENPWHFNWFQKPTEEQLRSAVKGHLRGQEIAVLEIQSSFNKDIISCDACHCKNGRHYYIRVNKSEFEKLKTLNFFEIKEIPKFENIDTTK
ncbi:MAG TPA: hypothetical protein PKK18_11980 [Chitinophagales bacterium]|nr:hypothetical protein [Chitinophagales bacterium]HMW11721.1 hypothetical protein [Chitinophagales bacterium]HMZ33261.1 hypothetical protein [Chitinophagales bacterium]HNC73072.1 hypothetical protein [Chitinophagales bacterium]HND82746.1 hypothetical protein [Chitinophagales bacterium]